MGIAGILMPRPLTNADECQRMENVHNYAKGNKVVALTVGRVVAFTTAFFSIIRSFVLAVLSAAKTIASPVTELLSGNFKVALEKLTKYAINTAIYLYRVVAHTILAVAGVLVTGTIYKALVDHIKAAQAEAKKDAGSAELPTVAAITAKANALGKELKTARAAVATANETAQKAYDAAELVKGKPETDRKKEDEAFRAAEKAYRTARENVEKLELELEKLLQTLKFVSGDEWANLSNGMSKPDRDMSKQDRAAQLLVAHDEPQLDGKGGLQRTVNSSGENVLVTRLEPGLNAEIKAFSEGELTGLKKQLVEAEKAVADYKAPEGADKESVARDQKGLAERVTMVKERVAYAEKILASLQAQAAIYTAIAGTDHPALKPAAPPAAAAAAAAGAV